MQPPTASVWIVILTVLLGRPAQAGQAGAAGGSSGLPIAQPESVSLPLTFDGSPPPVLPETVSRDGSGGIMVRAVRLAFIVKINRLFRT